MHTFVVVCEQTRGQSIALNDCGHIPDNNIRAATIIIDFTVLFMEKILLLFGCPIAKESSASPGF